MGFGLSWFSSALYPAHLPDSQPCWSRNELNTQSSSYTEEISSYISIPKLLHHDPSYMGDMLVYSDWLSGNASLTFQLSIPNLHSPVATRAYNVQFLSLNPFSINIHCSHASCPMQHPWGTLTSGSLGLWNGKRIKNIIEDNGYKRNFILMHHFYNKNFILNCHYILHFFKIQESFRETNRDISYHLIFWNLPGINHDKTELMAEAQISHSL